MNPQVLSPQIIGSLGVGLVFGLSALGSAIGLSIVGTAAVGAWKRCYKANKPAPMTIMALCGMPMSQTFYGFILLLQMRAVTITEANAGMLLGYGIASGIAMCLSAIAQAKISAAAADAVGETGKGFANYIAVLGIAETIALFTMVFTMISLG